MNQAKIDTNSSKTNQARIDTIMTGKAVRKIGWRNWQYISKKNNLDQDIGRAMFNIGRGINQGTNVKTNTCGEDTYLAVRDQFVDMKILDALKNTTENNNSKQVTNKKAIKKIPKIDVMRQQNTANKMAMEITEIKQLNGKINHTNNFDSRYAELTIIRLITNAKGYVILYEKAKQELKTKSANKYSSNEIQDNNEEISQLKMKLEKLESAIVEIIVGYKKILDDRSNKSFYPNISTTCLSDLSVAIDILINVINFQISDVVTNKKELLFRTKYDNLMTERQINMYDSQRSIFDFITTEPKCLGLVHTMLGSGKTEMVRPLCGWAMSNLKSNVTKLLYCCPNEAVLLEVARMVYSLGVPFGLVIYDINKKKINYKWSSFCTKGKEQESAVLYIADVYCAWSILSEAKKSSDFILIADELTKDADSIENFQSDSKYSVVTEFFIKIMKILPDKSLIMSATLPTYEQLPKIYDASVSQTNAVIRSFSASDAKIGCALIDSDGYYYAPHFNSKCRNDLTQILQTIETNPFIGRFYTYEILLLMVKIHTLYKLRVPDLSVEFSNVSNAKQNNIQRLVAQMLTELSYQSDDIIEKVSNRKNYLDTKINPVDLSKIFTRDINRFNKGTIIFATNPLETAVKMYEDNFNNFLHGKDINTFTTTSTTTLRNIFEQIRFDDILAKYDKAMNVYKAAVDRIINKSDEGSNKKNRTDNKKERDSSSSGSNGMAQLYDSLPKWDFPLELQIGSLEHADRVDRLYKQSTYNPPTSITQMTADMLPRDSTVSPDIMMMLASGIGIYTTVDNRLDDIYLKCVLDFAKSGIIKTIIADSSIAYGTNLSVSDIVIIDEPNNIVDKHSMKTMFQMMGRAGRGGNLSYEARIYTTSESHRLIVNLHEYSRNNLIERTKDEVANITRAFNDIWNK